MTDERYEILPPSGAALKSRRPQGSEELLLLRAFLLRIAALALCIGAVVVIFAVILMVA